MRHSCGGIDYYQSTYQLNSSTSKSWTVRDQQLNEGDDIVLI